MHVFVYTVAFFCSRLASALAVRRRVAMAPKKRKLLDSMPTDACTAGQHASAVSRHANRRSLDEATKRSILEHFPAMSELYMTQHKVDGSTIEDRVLAAKMAISLVVFSGRICEPSIMMLAPVLPT
jgi:hypothetical protein